MDRPIDLSPRRRRTDEESEEEFTQARYIDSGYVSRGSPQTSESEQPSAFMQSPQSSAFMQRAPFSVLLKKKVETDADVESESPLTYRIAVGIARKSKGQLRADVHAYLERAIDKISKRIKDDPNGYALSGDEFTVVNFFKHRFQGSSPIDAAITRYWHKEIITDLPLPPKANDSGPSSQDTAASSIGTTEAPSNCSTYSTLSESSKDIERAGSESKALLDGYGKDEGDERSGDLARPALEPAQAKSITFANSQAPALPTVVSPSIVKSEEWCLRTPSPITTQDFQNETKVVTHYKEQGDDQEPGLSNINCAKSSTSTSATPSPPSSITEAMQRLERTLTQLAVLASRLGKNRTDGNDDTDESTGFSEDGEDYDEELILRSSSARLWRAVAFGSLADGSDKADSAQSVSSSQNASIYSHSKSSSLGSKRTSCHGPQKERDEDEESPQKSSRNSPDSEKSERTYIQIPCFVENCIGKDTYVSELIRKAGKHHSFFACTRCYLSFNDENEYQSHSVDENCEPHCISSECEPSTPVNLGNLPPERRHKRRKECPAIKTVSTRDRWHYLYYLRYPDRVLPDPVLMPGFPHPHGHGQPRPQRRHMRQVSDFASFEERLTKARNELQALRQQKNHEDKIRDLATQQQQDRIVRLENIIVAFVSLFSGSIPNYLERMITHDAPSVFQSDTNLQVPSLDPVEYAGVPMADMSCPPGLVPSLRSVPGPVPPLTPPTSVEKRQRAHDGSLESSPNKSNGASNMEMFPREDEDTIFRDLFGDPNSCFS